MNGHSHPDALFLQAAEVTAALAVAEDLFPAPGAKIRELVHTRMSLLFNAWMTSIGHKRPGVAGVPGAKPGLPLAPANEQAAEIAKQSKVAMSTAKP